VRDRIQTLVAGALGADRAPDLDRGLFDLGLDSLAVVEIRRRLAADFGVALTNAEMFNYPTITALTACVVQKLRPATDSPASAPGPAGALSARELMDRIAREFDALGPPGV
jgi:acyl carrier protein